MQIKGCLGKRIAESDECLTLKESLAKRHSFLYLLFWKILGNGFWKLFKLHAHLLSLNEVKTLSVTGSYSTAHGGICLLSFKILGCTAFLVAFGSAGKPPFFTACQPRVLKENFVYPVVMSNIGNMF